MVDPAFIERKIVFYVADAGTENGVPRPIDLGPAIQHVNTMPFSATGRYLEMEDSITCVWVDRPTSPSRVRLATVRRTGLPQLEELGNLRQLRIRATQGIAEQVHVVLFPESVAGLDRLIAGAVFNFYGPRVPKLAQYLSRKAPALAPRATFRPLLRRDAEEALRQLTDVRLFRLRIVDSYIGSITEESQTLSEAFELVHRAGRASDVEVVLRTKKRSRTEILEPGVLDIARRLARRDDIRHGALDFEVKGLNGETGHIDLVDVLSDKLVATKNVRRAPGRGRALNSSSAYRAIQEAYDELRDDLLEASSLWVPA